MWVPQAWLTGRMFGHGKAWFGGMEEESTRPEWKLADAMADKAVLPAISGSRAGVPDCHRSVIIPHFVHSSRAREPLGFTDIFSCL